MWYLNLEERFISRRILHQHWYTCPVALLVRRNPQHKSLLTVVSVTCVLTFNLLISAKRLPPRCEPLYATNASHRTQELFIYEYSLHWALLPTNSAQQNSLFVRPTFWLLKEASEHVYELLVPRLSRSWAVLLPSDTHAKPITSITADLLPFVTYLLTLPHNWIGDCCTSDLI
jgi:hypothetical protein